MKLKFRPSFEQLDARDLPSVNPLNPVPPSDPPPIQTSGQNLPSQEGDVDTVANSVFGSRSIILDPLSTSEEDVSGADGSTDTGCH